MTTSFTITPTPPTSIKLQPGQRGELSFTVTCLAAPDKTFDLVFAALRVGADGKGKEVDWLTLEPSRTLRMSGGMTETVKISARPTTTSPRGENTLKLVIAEKDQPNEVYAESATVTCEVVGAAPPPPPHPPGKFPLWLILAIAGGVVLIAGGALLIWKLSGGPPGLHETCRSDASPACEDGLVCVADSQKCLLVGGATCKATQAGDCASGECVAVLGQVVCSIPLGAACNPTEKDTKPCLVKTVCDQRTSTCLGNEGAPCKLDAECVTGKCTANRCVVKLPPLRPGDPCVNTCPEPMQCSTTTKRCVEQLGRPCTNNNQCATGLCEQNLCSKPEVLRDCTQDGICGADQKCLEVQPGLRRCQWRPGHACRGDGDCSSKWCNQGICTRDDGKCDTQSDCRSPLLCSTARQQCLKPTGLACGANAECNSNFCSGGRCTPLNLAAGKFATQSSTVLGGAAARAVDRNTDGNWEHNSVTHSEINAQAWWQVDLGTVADIDKVMIYNRTDCCPERLSNFDLLLSNDGATWRTVASFTATPPPVTTLSIRTAGRFVRVRLRGTNYLSLAEVEVFTP